MKTELTDLKERIERHIEISQELIDEKWIDDDGDHCDENTRYLPLTKSEAQTVLELIKVAEKIKEGYSCSCEKRTIYGSAGIFVNCTDCEKPF